jgi:hypothetical protein
LALKVSTQGRLASAAASADGVEGEEEDKTELMQGVWVAGGLDLEKPVGLDTMSAFYVKHF